MVGSTDIRGETSLFMKLQQVQEIRGHDPCDKYNSDETGLFLNLQPSNSCTFHGGPHHDGTKSKKQVTMLRTCSADGNRKLPPLVIGKYRSPVDLRMLKHFPENMMPIHG